MTHRVLKPHRSKISVIVHAQVHKCIRLSVLCCFYRCFRLRCLTGFLIVLCVGVYDATEMDCF